MEYSILESLYNISVALAGTTPKLNTISPDWLKNLLVQHEYEVFINDLSVLRQLYNSCYLFRSFLLI
jgi:hypothetical protein